MMYKGGTNFFLDFFILFAEQRAPFRMSDDDIAAAQFLKHGC